MCSLYPHGYVLHTQTAHLTAMLRGGLSSVKGGQQEKDLRDFEDGDHPGERLGVGGIRFMAFGVVEGHAAQDQDRDGKMFTS